MYSFEDIVSVPPYPTGEAEFVNELRKYLHRKPHWQKQFTASSDMTDLRGGWIIDARFPDPDGLLDSAYDALERFQNAYIKKSSDCLTVVSKQDSTLAFEEYIIDIAKDTITLSGADTEGIRRAVYALLDMIRGSSNPALAVGTIRRKPWLKNRISRCFFGPIKRPPFFRDELTDDIDYYPEGYLDQLASEGVNGIWLTIVWKELASTRFFPEDPLRAKRIEKLKRTVEKCRKYGIKVWVFCIEPASWQESNPLPAGGEDMMGEPSAYRTYHAFCIAGETAQKYVRETTFSIFRDVPDLGGMMLISLGERPTSCLSYIDNKDCDNNPCAGKCGLSNSEILNKVLSSIKAGIRDAQSNAEVLSWLYSPRPGQIKEWWFDLPSALDEDKILAFNFESGVTKAQTGKVHAGGDYWLSAVGPSDRFGRMAAAAKERCGFAAKIQVGCSHELATVPFMPVPGNLYQKYKAMKALGVQYVIQCWYFGNYPGTMNRAAGLLAYEDFTQNEKSFLTALARPEWGEDMAEKIADMWLKFGESYSNYPLDIQYQYYGPMHDGIVWPLHVKQVMRPLPRSWKPDNFPAGDVLGESMVNHTIADIEILTKAMADIWNDAVSIIPELREKYADDPDRQRDCDLYEALQLLINSGANITRFYHLRQMLHAGNKNVIPTMMKLVETEKTASAKMTELCGRDCRLGYHSEAEIYKYYPAKLRWRIAELEKTAAALRELAEKSSDEITELTKWKGGILETGKSYSAETYSFSIEKNENELVFTLKYNELPENSSGDMRQVMLMDKSAMKFPVIINAEPDGEKFAFCNAAQGCTVNQEEKNKYVIRIPWCRFDYASEIFVGVQRIWYDDGKNAHTDNVPAGKYNPEHRLNFAGHSPERYALLLIEE